MTSMTFMTLNTDLIGIPNVAGSYWVTFIDGVETKSYYSTENDQETEGDLQGS